MARDRYGIVILAAGNSSRLGQPKQLLPFEGQTLIRHITGAACAAVGDQVMVVTGSNAPLMQEALSGLPCHFAHNPDWPQGMASSIQKGIKALQIHFPDVDGAILAVSDQPFVSTAVFAALIDVFKKGKTGIIASAYGGSLGVPAFFAATYFPALLELTGAEGAKKLFKRFASDVSTYPFPKGSIDIDTQEDYQQLISLR